MSKYTQRWGWTSWWTRSNDGRKIHVRIDEHWPLEEQAPVMLSIGRGAPVTLNTAQVTSLIHALHDARRAAAPRDPIANELLSGRGMRS